MNRQMNTAVVRTTIPAMCVTLLTWLIARAGWEPSAEDWQVIMLLVPPILSIAYRAAREVEARCFGIRLNTAQIHSNFGEDTRTPERFLVIVFVPEFLISHGHSHLSGCIGWIYF